MHVAHRCVDVAASVVRPDFANVEVLHEHAWVATPKLFGWDKSAWGHDTASSDLATFLEAGSFEDDTLVTNDYIVIDES